MAKEAKLFKSSVRYKIMAMFVLLTISVIIIIGTFMINRIDRFYNDEFETLMTNVFNEDFQRELDTKLSGEDPLSSINSSITAYLGQLGIDSFRNYYILDAFSGKALISSNSDLAKTLIASPNIIAAMNGKIGDISSYASDYMDYGVPVRSGGDTKYIVYIKDSKEEVDDMVNNILSIIFMALGLGIIISIAFGFLLSKTIISPISSLTQKAQRITSGDFGDTIEVNSSDEIGQLTKTFNDMAVELNQTLGEIKGERDKVETILRHMADGIMAFDNHGKIIHINPAAKKILGYDKVEKMHFNDIFKPTELTITRVMFSGEYEAIEKQMELGEKGIKLVFAKFKTEDTPGGVVVVIQDITQQQKLENSRREFVANVSHELRTPLTTVKGYVETMMDSVEENDIDKDMFSTFLGTVNKETDRMTRLVKDLLTLSKLDYGHRELKKEDVDVSHLVMGVVERMKINASSKNVRLIYEPTNQLPIIMGDKDRLEQVIVNIISNAIKYTPGGEGEVFVSTGRMYQNVYIKIKDNGMGIPKDDLPHVFERFYRVDKARSREQGGTGLGLAISNEIVKEHGGKITISSDYGVGTEVIIMLPVDE
ncbi:MAG: cell wall metabolism sensor histidine kinase WalK [Ruminococcaceae bacterium]|nr:cell wall metabolism sensor histidine kinase WalK [Oscillospiraceae bacterium]